MAYCPKCKQTFEEEGGFCPYDGTTLEPAAVAKPKLRAVSAADSDGNGLAALRDRVAYDPKAVYDRLIGTSLDGRYTIEKKIGEGGMGVVFLGRHTIIEKPVAIKVLKSEVARDHSVVKRFVQEAKAASRIGHPNIVDVTDFGTTPDGLTYSVMEFVEGDTLSALLKREAPLDLARALPIIVQIGRALSAAHDKGIVHRDLKPENIFVINRNGRNDFVKIVDFGIAKIMPVEGQGDGPRLTRAGSVFGTPEYMAPEQAAGRPDIDRRVDVYALGTILYEMLIGKVPHKGDSTVRTLAMQMLDPIEPPRKVNPALDISDALEGVVMKALAKKREERYDSMSSFIAGLEQVSDGVPLGQPLSPSTGQIVRNSEARTLVPLPPGADAIPTQPEPLAENGENAEQPRTVREEDLERDTMPDPLTQVLPTPAEAAAKKRQSTHGDPAFVGAGDKLRLDIYDDDERGGPSAGGSRWGLVLLVLLVLGGAAVAGYFLVIRSNPTAAGDSARTVASQIDAGALAAAPHDAGAASDGSTTIALATARDAGGKNPRGKNPRGKNPRGKNPRDKNPNRRHAIPGLERSVQIVTKPDGATLYIGNTYTATGNVTLRRPDGTELTITCRLPGYQNGNVELRFDGVTEVYLCKMKRVKKCVKDLKNPFDDCPE